MKDKKEVLLKIDGDAVGFRRDPSVEPIDITRCIVTLMTYMLANTNAEGKDYYKEIIETVEENILGIKPATLEEFEALGKDDEQKS